MSRVFRSRKASAVLLFGATILLGFCTVLEVLVLGFGDKNHRVATISVELASFFLFVICMLKVNEGIFGRALAKYLPPLLEEHLSRLLAELLPPLLEERKQIEADHAERVEEWRRISEMQAKALAALRESKSHKQPW